MTIRSRAAFDRATTDWSPLIPSLKSETAVIDLDGIHDCEGRVLVFESKPYPFEWKKEGNMGQYNLLKALAGSRNEYGNLFTVLVVYLETPGDVRSIRAAHKIQPGVCFRDFRAIPVTPVVFDDLMAWLKLWTRGL